MITQWVNNQLQWFKAQAEQQLLFRDAILKYTNYNYGSINSGCRKGFMSEEAENLIRCYNFLSPLPVNITVHRYVRGNEFKNLPLLTLQSDNAFMSTSLKQRPEFFQADFEEASYDLVYFTFYVQKGIICMNLLIDNMKEYEILFPSGTEYMLFEREVYSNELIHYTGMICS